MKLLKCTSFVILLALGVQSSTGQDFQTRNLIDLKVSARVIRGNESSFVFSYDLANSVRGTQSMWLFKLLIRGTPRITANPAAPNWNMSVFQDDTTIVKWFAQARVGVKGFKDVINPGDSRGGFAFESQTPPGITLFYSEGWAEPPHFEEGMAEDSIPGYTDLTPYGPGVVGRTVGPVLPPEPFDPVGFLDILLSYTFQADTLGWIAGQTTANEYTGYFSSAKTSLQNGNLSAARTTLRQVLRDADVDSSSAISSEAYALLRYNTEYLLSKLPAPPAITALNPRMTIAGSGPFALLVSGMSFEGSSKVRWNGSDRTTTFIADTVLRASILATDVAAVGSPAVTVKNGDGSESDAAMFSVISKIAWVDMLISYKHKALDLGWIDDTGVANSLDQKLDNARKQLEQGNNKAAKNILEAFVNELEAQKGKHVSNAAFDLLKSNAEYLITSF